MTPKVRQTERVLDGKNADYLRNECTLRDLYTAADDVLSARGEVSTAAARAKAINQSDKRVHGGH